MTQPQIDQKYIDKINRKTSLVDMAYEAIRDAIVSGRIQPSQRLMQSDLARELNVSERTVREALARLAAKGLLIHEPYKGMRVSVIPLDELKEIYMVRAMLEGHAMELAASCITREDLDRMTSILPLTAANEDISSVHIAQEMNKEFHMIPIHSTKITILIRILEQLWELMFAYDLLYENVTEVRTQKGKNDLLQHTALIEALEAGDGNRAKQVTIDHINSTLDILLARLSDQSHTQTGK